MKEAPLVHCPNCNMDSLVRVMGGGAGLIFKGSGFYLTDYKKGPSPGGGEKEKKPDEKKSNDKK
jgi:predicted nucleic acid-binding Zn ribbon protein